MEHLKSILGVVCILVLAPDPAMAENLPYRDSMAAQSRTVGIPQHGVVLLQRTAGLGREVALSRALGQVLATTPVQLTGGQYEVVVARDVTMAKGKSWFLEVRGDGDWIRYRHDGYVTSDRNPPRPAETTLSAAGAEATARALVVNSFGSLVALGDGETLQPWRVGYLMRMVADASGVVQRGILASSITLTREVHGMPVLGPGSKVTVIIANDGTLVGFDVDWSGLQPSGRATGVLDLGGIRQREVQIAPLAAGASRQETLFECGYYDSGTWGARSALLQPACISAFQESPGDSMKRQIAIPAGTAVVADSTWTSTAIFAQ
jgi:hypothetical protein